MRKLLYLLLLLNIPAIAQEKRMAVVELSTSYLRIAPDYESALETQELMGTVVEIVGEKSYWREVITPQPYRAWCTEKGLIEMSENEIKEYKAAPKVLFTGLYGHVYVSPSLKSETICDLVGGDILRFIRKKGAWTEILLPSGKKGFVPSKKVRPHHGFTSIAQGEGSAESVGDDLMEKIIASAEELLGVPYLWGGMSSKGVDCSGLVRISYLMNGILLPRNASQMINCGDKVELNELQRGDLVFFGTAASENGAKPRVTHVGIYLGNNRIIHSSHLVRINSLNPVDEDYYENAHKLIAATRL